MSWWARLGDRMTERELRESWGRASVRALAAAVLGGLVVAAAVRVLGGPWLRTAVLSAWVCLVVTLVVRGVVLLDTRGDARRR